MGKTTEIYSHKGGMIKVYSDIPDYLKMGFEYGVKFSEKYKKGLLVMFHDDMAHDFDKCRHFTEKNGGNLRREYLLKKYGFESPLFYNDVAMEEILDIAAGKKFDYGIMFNTEGYLKGMKVFVTKSGNGKKSLEKKVIDIRGDIGTRHLAAINATSRRRPCCKGAIAVSETEGTVITFFNGEILDNGYVYKPDKHIIEIKE